jgi:integrase/recombinase XerD
VPTQLTQKSSPACSVPNLLIDDTILIRQEEEIQLLFRQGRQTTRSRVLFGICLYTACRINEACTLSVNDVYDSNGKTRPELLICKGNTKGKLATKSIPVIEDLRVLLIAYQHPERGYLFRRKFPPAIS